MSAIHIPSLAPFETFHPAAECVIDFVEGARMPEPYRGLLVHSGDMTSRLEHFFGGTMELKVLQSRNLDGGRYCREVLLRRAGEAKAVEYGAIEIHLHAFEPELRSLILEGRIPLGGILNATGTGYRSEPQAFFEISPSGSLCELLGIEPGTRLFGRCNILRRNDGVELAQIVEILPPVGPRNQT